MGMTKSGLLGKVSFAGVFISGALLSASAAYANEDAAHVATCKDLGQQRDLAEQRMNSALSKYKAMREYPDHYGWQDLNRAESDAKNQAGIADRITQDMSDAHCFKASSGNESNVSAEVIEAANQRNLAEDKAAAELDIFSKNVKAASAASEEAYQNYNQGNYSQACERSKTATLLWSTAQAQGRAYFNTHASPSVNVDQLDINAKEAAEDQAKFYCKSR
jgi:hypothetical protein